MVVDAGLTPGLEVVVVNPEGLLVQLYLCPLRVLAPIVMEEPLQILVSFPAFTEGSVFTMIFFADEYAEQPFASMVFTESLEELFTVIDCEVSPVDHKYFLAAVADKLTDPPWQNVVEPLEVIVGITGVLTTIFNEEDQAEHPLISVVFTESAEFVFITIDLEVSPVDHR